MDKRFKKMDYQIIDGATLNKDLARICPGAVQEGIVVGMTGKTSCLKTPFVKY